MIVRFCAALLLIACPFSAHGATLFPTVGALNTETIIANIDRGLAEAATKGFGGAVVIEQGGKTLLSKGYGYANRKRGLRFTPDTVAQIGSVTKSQTGAALATLIAEGRVSLSDPVSKFVPDAPEPGRSRTIGQLASHTSGLMDECTNDFDQQSERMLIDVCLAKPLAYTPGQDHYSNLNYSVLALIIERATGKAWEQALRDRVWEPLGMQDVGYSFRTPDDQLAHGYMNDVEQPVISRSISGLHGNDWALRGNGGVQASARSMIRFLDGILDPQSGIGPKARQLMLSPVQGQTGQTREGLGMFFHYKDGQLYRMGHSGSDGIFFSYLAWVPATDVRFYFVGNNGAGPVKAVLKTALDQIMTLPVPSVGAPRPLHPTA